MESTRAPVRADLFDPSSLATLGHVEIIARWVVDSLASSLAQEGILGRVRGVPRLSARRRSSLHRLEDRRAREQVGRQAIRGGDELRATTSSTSAARWPGRATRRELRSSRTRSNSSPRSRYCSSGSATPSASFVTTIVCERSFRRRADGAVAPDPARARGRGRRSRVHRADGPVARRAAGSPPRHGRPYILDLLVETAEVADAVRMLRAVGHDVTVLHIMDPSVTCRRGRSRVRRSRIRPRGARDGRRCPLRVPRHRGSGNRGVEAGVQRDRRRV